MTEKKFLSLIVTEGVLLLSLGLVVLVLPKIISVSFGFMLCLSFLVYGGYKAINAFLSRNFSMHYILDIISGVLLMLAGVMLYFAPAFNVLIIISLIGLYFLLGSLSSSAFAFLSRNILYLWYLGFVDSLVKFVFALISVIILPSAALWLAGILAGISFIVSGVIMLNMYISKRYAS